MAQVAASNTAVLPSVPSRLTSACIVLPFAPGESLSGSALVAIAPGTSGANAAGSTTTDSLESGMLRR